MAEQCGHLARIARVNVWRDEVEVRSARLPHVDHIPLRAATGDARGPLGVERVTDRGISVHRQWQHGFAGGDNLVDIARSVPAFERLVGKRPETVLPAPRGLADAAGEIGGNSALEQAVGGGRVVAGKPIAAAFILDLDHDDAVVGVGLAQMLYQPDEGALVGLERGPAERR